MADYNDRLITLIQINTERFEWTKFLEEINKLGYKRGADYFHNGTGNPSAMFKPEVANDAKVKKLRDKYKVSAFGIESVASATVIRKSNLTEGTKVIINDKSKFNHQVGIIVEAQNTNYKIKLSSGTVLERGLHEIKTQKALKEDYSSVREWKDAVRSQYRTALFYPSGSIIKAVDNGVQVGKWEDEIGQGIIESLDPIGKENADINNDGKINDTDSYLKNRRQAIANSVNEESTFEEKLNEFIVMLPNDETGEEEEESTVALTPNTDFDNEQNYSKNLSPNLSAGDREVLVHDRKYQEAICENTSVDYSDLSSDDLAEFAFANGVILNTRSQAISELNEKNITQSDLSKWCVANKIYVNMDEGVNSVLAEVGDFPFNKLVDFRYFDENQTFGTETEEYRILDTMEQEEWLNYLDLMADSGITVEYDLVEDEYKVIPSTTSDENEELEENNLYEDHLTTREEKTQYIVDNNVVGWENAELDMLDDKALDKLYLQVEKEVNPTTQYAIKEAKQYIYENKKNNECRVGESYCEIEEQDTQTINNLAESKGFKVKFAKGLLNEGKETGKVRIIVEKWGVETEIVYNNNTLGKPWKIGKFEFNFMREALNTIKKLSPEEIKNKRKNSHELLNKFLTEDLAKRRINR